MEENYQSEYNTEEEKKKNWTIWYRVILAVVTIVCIGIGIVRFIWLGKTNSGNIVSKTVEVDQFNSMNIDVSMAEFTLLYGDSYQVEYQYPEKITPKIEVKNNRLSITQKTKGSIGLRDFHNAKCALIVTVPKGTEFDTVSMDIDMGALKLDGLTAKTLDLDVDMGDVGIKNSNFGVVTLDADMGNIELEKTTIESCTLDADMGSIQGRNLTCGDITCSADMGSIELNGDFESVTATCSMGSVEVTTEKSENEVRLNLEADMGSVTFNGKNMGKDFHN